MLSRRATLKWVLLCCLVLLLCFSAACKTAEPTPSPLPSTEPSVSPSAESSNSPAPAASPTPTPKPEPLSYEEYFSEERKPESEYRESGIYDDRWEKGKIYLRSTGEVLAEYPERWVVIAGEDTDELLIYDEMRIFVTENSGKDRVLIYEAESNIERAYSPDPSTLFAFIDGTKRYQMYVPSRTVDFLFDLPGVLTEDEYYELAECEEVPQDALYVWAEELETNYIWRVQIAGESDEWLAALAAYEGVTVEKFVNTDGASFRVAVCYNSQTDEWETTKKAEFVRDFINLD